MRKRIFAAMLALCMTAGVFGYMKDLKFPAAALTNYFVYEEDTWGFSEEALIDGKNPYLLSELQSKLLGGKSEAETERIKAAIKSPLTDLSYGFAALELLYNSGVWSVEDISNTAETLHDISTPVRKDALVGLINYYNLLQYMDNIAELDAAAAAAGDSAAIKAADSAAENGMALLRVYESAESTSAETLLIYGKESGSWTYSSSEYDSRLLVSSSSHTEFSDDACLYYSSKNGKWIIPDMGYSSIGGAALGAVIDDAELINTYGYAPSKLPRMMIERVFAYPGEYDVPITLMQSGIPEVLGISMNVDLSEAAAEVMKLSYETYSYDLGSAMPSIACSTHVNDQALIVTSVISASATNAFECAENEPIISFLMDAAERDAVISAAEKYGLELQTDDVYGDYYAFPLYFNVNGMSSYYSDAYEASEFPLVMNSEICIVMEPAATTTTTTTAATTTASSSKATTTITSKTTVSSSKTVISSKTEPTSSAKTTTSATTKADKPIISGSTASTSAKTTAGTTLGTTSTTKKTTVSSSVLSSDKSKTTTVTETTTSVTTTRISFDWGVDNWSVSHDMLAMEYLSGGYGLLDEHEENLNASLNAMERVRIRSILESDWLGAEYGMAVTEILGKSDVFSVSMWDPSVKSVYELDTNDERNRSLISYYQLLQETDAVQQQIAWTSGYMTQQSVLMTLIDIASKAAAGGDMAIVCMFGNDYARAAIAYDMEYGLWRLGSEEYDGRVLIADPHMSEFSDEACIYFKSSTLEWSVPLWNISSSDGKSIIGLASSSLSMMNYAGYFMGTSSYVNSHAYIPILEVPAGASDFTIKPVGGDESDAKTGAELDWFSTVASFVTHHRAGLDYLAEGYEITPQTSDIVSYQMSYEDCLLSVHADNAEFIAMLSDGTVSLKGSDSAFEISVTEESELPWDLIAVSGDSSDMISVEHQGDGVLVLGDNVGEINITADDIETSVSRKLTGGDYSAVFIYAEDDGSIGILVDKDGDGECESVLQDEAQENKADFGDVNLDGSISMSDLVAINLYLADCIMLNEESLMNSDCDENLRINSIDSQLILRFLVEDFPALPLSKALEMMSETE